MPAGERLEEAFVKQQPSLLDDMTSGQQARFYEGLAHPEQRSGRIVTATALPKCPKHGAGMWRFRERTKGGGIWECLGTPPCGVTSHITTHSVMVVPE